MGAQPKHVWSGDTLRSLTNCLGIAAVLDYVDGDVVIVHTRCCGVDAGKPGAAGAAEEFGDGDERAVAIQRLWNHACARAAVSAIVAFEKETTNNTRTTQHRTDVRDTGR